MQFAVNINGQQFLCAIPHVGREGTVGGKWTGRGRDLAGGGGGGSGTVQEEKGNRARRQHEDPCLYSLLTPSPLFPSLPYSLKRALVLDRASKCRSRRCSLWPNQWPNL
jgi:hypothetical protein